MMMTRLMGFSALIVFAHAFCLCSRARRTDTFSVTRSQVTFSDSGRCLDVKNCNKRREFQIRFGRHISVEVFRPLNASQPTPLVVFAYTSPDTVLEIANHTASAGFVVATMPVYEPSNPWGIAEDLLFVVHEMYAENETMSSPYYGLIKGNLSCILGQGLAAEATVLASMDKIDTYRETMVQPAVIALAPRFNGQTGISHAAASMRANALVLASQSDCLQPSEEHALPVYTALNRDDPCKTYVEILGGNSCFFADNLVSTCFELDSACGAHPDISPASQRELTLDLLIDWLGFTLKESEVDWASFQNTLLSESSKRLVFAQSCQKFNSTNSHTVPLSLAKGE